MLKKLLLTTAIASTSFAASTADLEARIEELELARDLNTWSFSGELETRYNTINEGKNEDDTNYTTLAAAGVGKGETSDNYVSYLRLNVEAKPSDKMTFFGRLSMAKYWNSFQERETASLITATGNGGRGATGPELYVERAFFNYVLTSNLTFTAGRIPTIDGPSDHFTKGNSRSGAYPRLAYAAIFDGVALTHSAKILNGSLATRLIFTPFNNVGLGDVKNSSGMEYKSTSDVLSAMVDYENVQMPGMQRFNFIAQYIMFNDLYIDVVKATDGTTPVSDVNADYRATTFAAEFNGVAGTNLDLAFQYKMTSVDNTGSVDLTYASKGNLGGFLTSSDEKVKGNQMLINASYGFMNKFRLGFEYQSTDKDVFAVDLVSTDPIGFYSTADSKGMHAYLVSQIDNNLKVILGYMKLDMSTYRPNGILGDGKDVDITKKAGYLSIITSF